MLILALAIRMVKEGVWIASRSDVNSITLHFCKYYITQLNPLNTRKLKKKTKIESGEMDHEVKSFTLIIC